MFENRTYRAQSKRPGLVAFKVTVKETDLHIQADTDLSGQAVKAVLECRQYIEAYIQKNPGFLTAMKPIPPGFAAPAIVSDMIDAGQKAGVGPMAAVAGAVAEFTGRRLLKDSREVIVENGGDIFMKLETDAVFSIFAGKSPLSMRTGIRLKQRPTPLALCTSSGTLGHSKSYGRADAASVIAESCALADAAATALGNMVSDAKDIENAIHAGKAIPGIQGLIIIKGKHMGVWGDLELVKLS